MSAAVDPLATALGETAIWTARIIAAATAAGEACPFCRREVAP